MGTSGWRGLCSWLEVTSHLWLANQCGDSEGRTDLWTTKSTPPTSAPGISEEARLLPSVVFAVHQKYLPGLRLLYSIIFKFPFESSAHWPNYQKLSCTELKNFMHTSVFGRYSDSIARPSSCECNETLRTKKQQEALISSYKKNDTWSDHFIKPETWRNHLLSWSEDCNSTLKELSQGEFESLSDQQYATVRGADMNWFGWEQEARRVRRKLYRLPINANYLIKRNHALRQ